MSLKIYLLRHGETKYSQRGAYCGALDAELTTEGHQMAQAFAEAYRTIPWADIYVSPMKRAIATAQPLCDAVGLPMQIRDGLREIGYGAWEDLEPDYVRQHYEHDYIRWQTDPAWNPPTDGETAIQIAARALPVITEIESRHKNGNDSKYFPHADDRHKVRRITQVCQHIGHLFVLHYLLHAACQHTKCH